MGLWNLFVIICPLQWVEMITCAITEWDGSDLRTLPPSSPKPQKPQQPFTTSVDVPLSLPTHLLQSQK